MRAGTRWIAVLACVLHASLAVQPAAGDVPCSADSECFPNLLAPVCNASSGKCAASGAFRTTAGACACDGGAASGCSLRVIERTAGHAAGCLEACLSRPRCGAVEAVFNRGRRDFDCALVDAAEADDPDHSRARSSTTVCHWRSLEAPLGDDHLPDSLDSSWFLVAVVAMFSVMLLTCGMAICCCVRARGQRIAQRRRAHHARQFERPLEEIMASRLHERNPTGSMREGYRSGSGASLARSMSDEARRLFDLDLGPMFEDQMAPRRIRCNLVPQAEVDSLTSYYNDWLNDGRAPSYIVAFINPHSGDQSAGIMETEFRRLLYKRGEGIGGMVCHLGTGGVAGALNDVAELQRLLPEEERRIHLLVCGGDGTVTWVLSEIEAFMQAHPNVLRQQPPIGIVPMGTGNDLARSLGWDSKFRDSAHVARYVHNALEGTEVELDQWKVTLRPKALLPPALHSVHGLEHVAYFQNYFSVGMDAQITHGVHLARRDSCGRCCFRAGIGKVCYVVHAPCRCCCCASPPLDLQVYYVPADSHDPTATIPYEAIGEARQFTMTNINSYGGGRVLFSSEDLERVRPNDGLLEVFTVPGPLALALLNNPLGGRSTPFLQARKVEMTLGAGQFFQLDGEPFFVDAECRVTVEHHRKVRLLCPPEGRGGQNAIGGVWRGRQRRAFWREMSGATPRQRPRRAAGAPA